MPETAAATAEKETLARGTLDDLVASLQETAEGVVPWFLENMPLVYFQDTPPAERLSHLRAIIAAKASGRPPEMTLRSEDGNTWTSMRPQDAPGVLAELVSELPHDRPLRAAKIHTALDGNLVLDTFEFGETTLSDMSDPRVRARLAEIADYARTHDPSFDEDAVLAYAARCAKDYVFTVTPLRFCQHLQIVSEVSGTDGTEVGLEAESDPDVSRIVVAVANASQRRMLERMATRLAHSRINIHRAYLDVIDDGDAGSISLLGFVVSAPDGGPIEEDSDLWREIEPDLRRNKWIDNRALKLMYRTPDLDTRQAEIITALCDLTHQILVKRNPYAFNLDRIHRLTDKSIEHARLVAEMLLDRFDASSPLSDDGLAERSKAIRFKIDNDVDLEDIRTILHCQVDAVSAVLRTNVHLENRFALAMRLDPTFLRTEERSELPYGVFFVHARGMNGFHVRFRDIARGGLRVVPTRGEEQHALEAERLYDEAYNLAFAQQLKNKDIPEGGAKAAILMDPYARLDRSVKAFVDGILDLVTPDPEVQSQIVDHFGKPELLYFGPDENILPRHIEWIVNRAAQRAYPLASAIMSSKPGAGMNHKEYGVTSEGVNVFLDTALRAVGIDPDVQPFTIKMTGGPDGDVGGNLIRIAHRDYGDRVRIVGIADGSGSGEDPDGLDLAELLRLFEQGLPIASFDRGKVGPNGRITAIDEPDGVMLRNTLHNRVVADAFVPCGGRPAAMHARNWKEFLTADGSPSAKVIVEGANLFLTAEARHQLSDVGVLIMKDSSANKCGVITSSYEIIANMAISEEEFLAVKPQFVDEVLERLRDLARREAQLLVRMHRHHPNVPLPVSSIRLSRVLLRTADAIEEQMERLDREHGDLMRRLVIDHVPPILLATAGERFWERMPDRYLAQMKAKSLAARICYREGIESLDAMPMGAIADLAVRYLQTEIDRDHMADVVASSSLPEADSIARVIRGSGIMSLLAGD